VWFANPLALLFAGLYGVLVLFYLWERWRRRIPVPALLLWQAVREDTIRARRFRPDLLFVLQLLLLSALIFGLAGPYLRGHGDATVSGRHIFVLDTSASMQAREVRASRFEEARAAALDLLGNLAANDEVMLITAGDAPAVVLGFTRDHDAVARALQETTPTDTGGDLAVALAFADAARRRSDLPATVAVFTDIPRAQLPSAMHDTVTVYQVGETDDNIGIQALQVFQGRFQDYRRARAHVLVENYAHREGHGFLTVQLGDQVVTRTGFTIPARETKGFLVSSFPGPGVVMARLEAADALAADNIAFGWIRPMSPVRVLVVSATPGLVKEIRDLAAATPGLQLSVAAPDAVTPEQLAQVDIAIYHRVVPNPPPAVNALYIDPDVDNPLFPVVGDASDIEVLDWAAAHPALASIRPLAALPLQRTRIVTPPAWSQVLLWSRTNEREFPLALAGEHDGRRVACITFDLEAERLLSSDNLNFFLFFMNLLAWLAPEQQDAIVVNTGEVRDLGPFPQRPVMVRDPRGVQYALDTEPPMLQPRFAGEYRASADGTRRTVFANFFDPVESDIGRASKEPPAPSPRPAASAAHAAPAADASGRHYGMWLYLLAVALFVLEWGAARRVST
jgi:VWA domain-containing protein/aerotolerance regulator-like protein